jgi:hypothetical protein
MRLPRLLCAAVLVGLVACADNAGDDVQDTTDAITAAQAAGELERIIQSPTRLKGVEDPVHEVRGEGGATWTFYPYHAPDTLADADEASLFLVAGSRGEIFFVDVVSGAAAGATPPGIVIEDAARRLGRDLKASSVKTQAVPGAQAVANSLGERLSSSVAGLMTKLANGGFVRDITGLARAWGSKVVAYFTGSTAKETAPASLSKKIVALGESDVKVKSVGSSATPAKPIAIRTPTNLEILSSKTTGPVAVTLETGTALIKNRPNPTIWAPEGELLGNVPVLQNGRTGELILTHGDVPMNVAEELSARGFRIIWILPSRVVKGVADGSIAVRSGDALIESTSAETSRALSRSASQYAVKAWEEHLLLSKTDEELIKTPAFQIVEALAMRVNAGGPLPRAAIVPAGTGSVTKGQLARLVERAATILSGLGTRVNAAAVMDLFDGLVEDIMDSPDAGDAAAPPAPTTSTEAAPATTTTAETGEPIVAERSAKSSTTPTFGRKAKDDGCSAAPGSAPSGALLLGVVLAASMLARGRRARANQ